MKTLSRNTVVEALTATTIDLNRLFLKPNADGDNIDFMVLMWDGDSIESSYNLIAAGENMKTFILSETGLTEDQWDNDVRAIVIKPSATCYWNEGGLSAPALFSFAANVEVMLP